MFYLLLFFICTILGALVDKSPKGWDIVFTTCITLLLSIVGGVRDIGVGTDTTIYSWSYFLNARYLSSLDDFWELKCDKGYLVLNIIANQLTHKIWGAHLIVQLFTNGLVFYAAYKMRKIYPLKMSLFTFFYCCMFYNQTYNFMRQYCALAILLVGLYYMLNSRWKIYLLCQILAFFFHSSSILFITIGIAYYTCTIGYQYKWHYFVVLGSAFMVILGYTYFYQILSLLNSMDIISDTLANRYEKGDEFGAAEGVRKSLILLTGYIGYFIIISFKRHIFQRGYITFLLSLLFLFIAFYLLSFRSRYLYRLSLFFYLPLTMLISNIISSKQIYYIEKIGFVLLVLLDWYLYIVKHGGAEAYPYHSKILGI